MTLSQKIDEARLLLRSEKLYQSFARVYHIDTSTLSFFESKEQSVRKKYDYNRPELASFYGEKTFEIMQDRLQKFDFYRLRVLTQDVSVRDFVCQFIRSSESQKTIELFAQTSRGRLFFGPMNCWIDKQHRQAISQQGLNKFKKQGVNMPLFKELGERR